MSKTMAAGLPLIRTSAVAAEGKVSAQIETHSLRDINAIFSRLKAGTVRGRIALTMSK